MAAAKAELRQYFMSILVMPHVAYMCYMHLQTNQGSGFPCKEMCNQHGNLEYII